MAADDTTAKPGLKRVAKADWWRSGPAVLYIDDIEAIYRLFHRVSPDVTLRVDGYELPSLAEITQLRSAETRDLKMAVYTPHAAFEASGLAFQFYISDADNLELRGLSEAVEEVVAKRRLWSPRWSWPYWVLVIPTWFLWLVPDGPFELPASAISAVAVLMAVTVGTIIYRNRRRGGKLILRGSNSTPSFRERNRDLLLVLLGIIGTLLTTVGGGIILYALGFVGRPGVSPLP